MNCLIPMSNGPKNNNRSADKQKIIRLKNKKTSLLLATFGIIITIIQLSIIGPNTAEAHSKVIYTCNPAMATLVHAVAGKEFTVIPVTAITKSLHDAQLTPSMLSRLRSAAVIFYTSRYMQPALYNLSRSSLSIRVIEITQDDDFREQLNRLGYYTEKSSHPDGHLWNAPAVSSIALEVVYRHLKDIFPEQGAMFKSNLLKTQAALLQLHQWLINRMHDSCAVTPFFSMHESLLYLYKGLKLNFSGNLVSESTKNLSPQAMSALLHNQRQTCVFVDHNHHNHAWRSLCNMNLSNVQLISLDLDGMQVKGDNIEDFSASFKEKIEEMCKCLC